MRRYDIVSGILLIFSIINFALAAPVLGKRGFEELEKLAEEFYKTLGKPIESSDAHASSSSALPRPDHVLTDVWQAPAPHTTANPEPLMEPSGPLDDGWSNKGDGGSDVSEPLFTPGSSDYGSDHEWTGAHPQSPTEINTFRNVNLPPSPTESYSYSYPGSVVHPPSPGAGLPTVPDHEVVTPPSTNLGSPIEPEDEVVPEPPPTPELTDPEIGSNSQSLSADSLQAAIFAAKGKAKVSRRVSGTSRAVGNAAQRELQSTERSLDLGE